jgi:predicted transcriptional regulator
MIMTPKPESDMVRQSLWVSQSTVDALKKIADRLDRPVGYLLRKAAEEYVEREKAGRK